MSSVEHGLATSPMSECGSVKVQAAHGCLRRFACESTLTDPSALGESELPTTRFHERLL